MQSPATAALIPVQPRAFLDFPADVIREIAFKDPEAFRKLALICSRFAHILCDPTVQASAKQAFVRQHTFIQADCPNYTVVADRLPNGWAHGYVRLYDGDTLQAAAQFKNNHRHGEEYRKVRNAYTAGESKVEKRTTYHKGNRYGPQTVTIDGREIDYMVWVDNDTMSFRRETERGTVTETNFVNGHPHVIKVFQDGKPVSVTRYRQEKRTTVHRGSRTEHVERRPRNKDPATHKLYYLDEIEIDPDRNFNIRQLTLHGEQLSYSPDRSSWSVYKYRNGDLHGRYKTYHTSNGNLVVDFTYHNDNRQGPVKMYFPSGKLESCGNYVDGYLTGEHLTYYESGALRRRAYYRLGNQDGIETLYRQDGIVAMVSEYKKGSRTKYTAYNPDGSVASTKTCGQVYYELATWKKEDK